MQVKTALKRQVYKKMRVVDSVLSAEEPAARKISEHKSET